MIVIKDFLYEDLYNKEFVHWWFASKKTIVLGLLNKYLDSRSLMNILDVGCGSGLMLKCLEAYGKVYGLDSSEKAIEFSRKLFDGEIKKGTLPEDIPYNKYSFDIITALDILEHVEEDTKAIKSLYELLKNHGVMIITVPAYSFLWSKHDEIHQHKRRYTRKELLTKLKQGGFIIEKISYYNFFLFIPLYIVRKIQVLLKGESSTLDTKLPSPLLNNILQKIFSLEGLFLKHINFLFGVSLIAVVRKK